MFAAGPCPGCPSLCLRTCGRAATDAQPPTPTCARRDLHGVVMSSEAYAASDRPSLAGSTASTRRAQQSRCQACSAATTRCALIRLRGFAITAYLCCVASPAASSAAASKCVSSTGFLGPVARALQDATIAWVQSVSVSQKVVAGGYTGNATTGLVPTQTLLAAFDFIDSEVRPRGLAARLHMYRFVQCEAAQALGV